MADDLKRPLTASEREVTKANIRFGGDGLTHGFATPSVEPLASRLERADRVDACSELTQQMLADLAEAGWPCAVFPNVWVEGICVHFLTVTWKGVFLIWSIDHRWTAHQAELVMPARTRIQQELGTEWFGQVETVFHSPRQDTDWDRRVIVDERSGEPIDIVLMTGRIDRLLIDWQPVGEVGIDPEWIRWLCGASQPRWWRSAEGRRPLPEPPPHERL